ncbi:MAG TPA: hypothetical protein VML75_08330 [Kofleriaceae bacterium]|nr:hypothetical protein [Kofleriaceae bacterium]
MRPVYDFFEKETGKDGEVTLDMLDVSSLDRTRRGALPLLGFDV